MLIGECYTWAYQICSFAFRLIEPTTQLLILLLKIVSSASLDFLDVFERKRIESLIEVHLDCLEPLDVAEFKFAVAWLESENGNFTQAINALNIARKSLSKVDMSVADNKERADLLNNVNSWNMANLLLPAQDFALGWKLFEYGLCARAPGPQKWQRAMPKPFTYSQLPLWRGESLVSNSILLLEEQAIGDVMQFLTLIPSIIDEASHVGIMISDRLISIYERSFAKYISQGLLSVYTFDNVLTEDFNFSKFKYQSPIGSICKHRFTDISKFGRSSPILSSSSTSKELRDKYLKHTGKSRIVGISWRGGGREDRIKLKSVDVQSFSTIIKGFDDIAFISLQYGDVSSDIELFSKEFGVQVFHDQSINPLANMDLWLSQVASCDAVISVANTTIHGAGGLDKPTMCLLSQDSDWRWLKEPRVTRSYWYPSVGIARQAPSRSWESAFSKVRQWLTHGMPYPEGLRYL